MYMHPETFLWMHEQDRERAMTQRALERAARGGGEQRPGSRPRRHQPAFARVAPPDASRPSTSAGPRSDAPISRPVGG